MKFIYITSHKYPSRKTEPFFIESMARAFNGILGESFIFLSRQRIPKRGRALIYFLLLPVLVLKNSWHGRGTVFFSSDPYLLTILIFWRRMLRFRYSIASDWHQLFEDWRDKYVASGSDYLVTTSQKLKNLIIRRFGISSAKILVAYGGVDPGKFRTADSKLQIRKELGLPVEYLVGYVGMFRTFGLSGLEKGIDLMVKALKYLPANIKMVFVGGSPEQIRVYESLAREFAVLDRCIFVEKQPFEKMALYQSAMDILVIPYPNKPHFADWVFPMKVWEYMASGRPIIYSDLEIIREILGGRATSFKPDDVSSLVDAILSVRRDTASMEAIARNNQQEVINYTWEARAKSIVGFIHN